MSTSLSNHPAAIGAASLVLIALSGCTTSAAVEDADLFSAGNIGRYEREQEAREQRAEDLKQESERINSKLDERRQVRAELAAKEAELRERLAQQQTRLVRLETDIEQAREYKALTDAEYRDLQAAIANARTRTQKYREIRNLTRAELQAAEAAAAQNERTLIAIEDLRDAGFKDVSSRLRSIS